MATPLFVPIVEEGIFNGELLNITLNHYFKDISKEFDGIILGCTHFPLIKTQISNYFLNKPKLIHSGDAIVEHLLKNYQIKVQNLKTTIKFFASSNPEGVKKMAKKWLF